MTGSAIAGDLPLQAPLPRIDLRTPWPRGLPRAFVPPVARMPVLPPAPEPAGIATCIAGTDDPAAAGAGHVLILRPGDRLAPGADAAALALLAADPGAAACLIATAPQPGPMPPARIMAGPLGPVAILARRDLLARTGPEMAVDGWLVRLAACGRLLRVGGLIAGAPDPEDPAAAAARRQAALAQSGMARDWKVEVKAGGLRIRRRPDARRLLLTWPDYSVTNPYQICLYSGLIDRFEICAAAPAAAAALAAEGHPPAPPVLHLHWLNFLFRSAKGPGAARDRGLAMLADLARLQAAGGRVVWTVHNRLTHDAAFAEVETEISARLGALADAVILHAPGSAAEVAESFALPADRVHVARHGHFIGCYPDTIGRDAARAALDLPAGARVLAVVGRMRPYKGIDRLIAAFGRVAAADGQAILLLAGEAPPDMVLPAPGPQMRVMARFIPDDEIQVLLRAADAMVLPYRDLLTSGAALLGLGFGLPLVAPRTAMTADLIGASPEAGVLYDPAGGEEALESALRGICARLARGEGQAMSAAALRLAQARPWPDIGAILAGTSPG